MDSEKLQLTTVEANELKVILKDPDYAPVIKLLKENKLEEAFREIVNNWMDRYTQMMFKLFIDINGGFTPFLQHFKKLPEDLCYTRFFKDTAIIVPDNIEEIEYDSLCAYDTKIDGRVIKAVYIPKSVQKIDASAFDEKTAIYFEDNEDDARKKLDGVIWVDDEWFHTKAHYNSILTEFIAEYSEDII